MVLNNRPANEIPEGGIVLKARVFRVLVALGSMALAAVVLGAGRKFG